MFSYNLLQDIKKQHLDHEIDISQLEVPKLTRFFFQSFHVIHLQTVKFLAGISKERIFSRISLQNPTLSHPIINLLPGILAVLLIPRVMHFLRRNTRFFLASSSKTCRVLTAYTECRAGYGSLNQISCLQENTSVYELPVWDTMNAKSTFWVQYCC